MEKQGEIPVIGKRCLLLVSFVVQGSKKVCFHPYSKGEGFLIRLHDLGLDKRVKSVNAAR